MSCGDLAPSLGTVLLPGPLKAMGLGQRGLGWGRACQPPTL